MYRYTYTDKCAYRNAQNILMPTGQSFDIITHCNDAFHIIFLFFNDKINRKENELYWVCSLYLIYFSLKVECVLEEVYISDIYSGDSEYLSMFKSLNEYECIKKKGHNASTSLSLFKDTRGIILKQREHG